MFFTTSIILCFTFLNFLFQVQCAAELPALDNYGIFVTEWAIGNTVNNLFSTLKLKEMQQTLKLKQYSTIHNFFVSITLQDHDNLKEIARLTKVDNTDNSTQVFITQLSEVLNEDNKSDEATDAVYVTILIEEFLKRLDNLKEIYGLKNNTKLFDINKAVIRRFNNNENEFGNTTYLKENLGKGNDSNDNVLSSKEFWQPSGRRVFRGKKADIKRFPFMVSVQFFKKFQCGGSIIKSNLVITSASCLQLAWNNRFFRENPAFLTVLVGSTYSEYGGENIPVSEIHFHPSYNPKNLRHNLALMRILRALAFGKDVAQVKKINFDRKPHPLPSDTPGIVLIGWGARTVTNKIEDPFRKLSFSVLEFYPLEECQEVYSKEFVTNRNFCAGFFSKGGGACNRDAGGPGVAGGILVGVVSFGSPVCGAPDAPTVFTKLGYYTDWIEQIMELKIHQGGSRTTLLPHTRPHTFHIAPTYFTQPPTRKIEPIDEDNTPQPIDVSAEHLRIKDKTHDFKGFLATIFESEESTDYRDETQDEKELRMTKPKSPLKIKPKKKPEKKHKSKNKPIKKSKPKEKKKMKSKSERNPILKLTTTSYTNIFNEIATEQDATFIDYYDATPSTETSTSVEMVTPLDKPRNINKQKASSGQEKKMEEAIEVLIDNLNINDILESEESSPEKSAHEEQQQTTTGQYRNTKLIEPKHHLVEKMTRKPEEQNSGVGNKDQNEEDESYSNNKINNEYEKAESSDDTGDEEEDDTGDGTSENENYAQSDTDTTESNNMEDSNSNNSNENNLSVELIHRVDKNNEQDDYEVDYESDINKEFETFQTESIKKKSPSIDTEKLLDMLVDTNDVYELLVGHSI